MSRSEQFAGGAGLEYWSHEQLAALATHDYADTTVGRVLPHMEEHARHLDEDDTWQSGGPRQHVEHLRQSIAQRGVQQPLEVHSQGGRRWLADGHHRALAAISLQLPRIPVRVREL